MPRITEVTKERLAAPAQYVQPTDPVSKPFIVMTNLFTLLLVCALIVGLIFGGKWLYERITDKDNSANPITSISTGSSTKSGSSSTSGTSSSSGSSNASVTSNGSGTASVSTAPTSTATITAQTTNSSQQSATSGTSTVPNTGTGSMLGVFIVTATLSALGYRAYVLRKM